MRKLFLKSAMFAVFMIENNTTLQVYCQRDICLPSL